jgi:hypothetical protein
VDAEKYGVKRFATHALHKKLLAWSNQGACDEKDI